LADGSEYRGNYDIGEDKLADFHEERLKLLAEENPDIMAVETVPCLIEAKAVVKAVRRAGLNIPLWISFSCRDADSISDGTPIEECAAWLDHADEVVALGLNCTAPQYVSSLIEKIRDNTKKYIVVYPNSGETYDAKTKTWRGASASFVDMATAWHKAGARLIGGCCRTTPRDIEAIAAWARDKASKK
jgi:homocysteine S-methyltransferase